MFRNCLQLEGFACFFYLKFQLGEKAYEVEDNGESNWKTKALKVTLRLMKSETGIFHIFGESKRGVNESALDTCTALLFRERPTLQR